MLPSGRGTMLTFKIVKPDDAMDWLTFISSTLGSLAWPAIVFGIAYLFREQIGRLIDRIKKVSVGDKSVDFAERLDEAEAEATTALPPAVAEPAPAAALDARTTQLIALSPSAAIVTTWRQIEAEVTKRAVPLISRFGASATNRDGRVSFRASAKMLLQSGHISASTYALLLDLNEMRNRASHGEEELTVADATRFTLLAQQVQFFLDGPDVLPDNPDAQ